jgi:hypothetical protein
MTMTGGLALVLEIARAGTSGMGGWMTMGPGCTPYILGWIATPPRCIGMPGC